MTTKMTEAKVLVAWHGSAELKKSIVAIMAAHRKADTLVKGLYWEEGKGCAVGCLIHGSDHSLYEPRFGIPQALARLEDVIFENLPNGERGVEREERGGERGEERGGERGEERGERGVERGGERGVEPLC